MGWELCGGLATRVVPDSQRGPSIYVVVNADPLGFRHGGPWFGGFLLAWYWGGLCSESLSRGPG